MNIDDLTGYFVFIFLWFGLDCLVTWKTYLFWIKLKGLENDFYKWKGTNKPKKWFIVWTCLLFGNVLIAIIVPLFYMNIQGLRVSFIIILIYCGAESLAYSIVEYYVKHLQEKSKEEDLHDQEKKE